MANTVITHSGVPRTVTSRDTAGPAIVTIRGPGRTVISQARSAAEVVREGSPAHIVTSGIPGPPGPPGDVGNLSTDPGNALSAGSDGGLYAPDDITADPLSYYILAKN